MRKNTTAAPGVTLRRCAGRGLGSFCIFWAIALALSPGLALAQNSAARNLGIDWRHIGNSAIELGLPSVATGPVSRVWYSADGSVLSLRTSDGRTYQTSDFERWQQAPDGRLVPPVPSTPAVASVPEPGLKLSSQTASSGRIYGAATNVYRSDDGGVSWANLTAFKGRSILGGGLTDIAISPRDSDEVAVASANGVWRSVDGGVTWSGLNEFLPNLPTGHLLALASGANGVRLAVADGSAQIEWAPGEKSAWRPVDSADARREQTLKAALSTVGRTITSIQTARDFVYAGDSEGRLQVSSDGGATWSTPFRAASDSGPVEAIWVDRNDSRVAIAALGARSAALPGSARPVYVVRTMNAGIFWDDITDNLPDGASAHGVAADRTSGAIYVATDAGVFYTQTELTEAGRSTPWTLLSQNLPAAPATDVRLDAGANQLYAAVSGYGVYVAIAPHRLRDARVVSAADLTARPAAPGALLSVLGTRVQSASSADTNVPVLDATDASSQIQVPFEASGNSVMLSLNASAGRLTMGLPLQSVSPAIFVDAEGAPLILDAATGVLLDSTKPAHAGGSIQVLATGLGRVSPDWPTGLAAPLTDPPRVRATVHALLDGAPVEVTRASLAPGYVGFYLVEIQLPRILNAGSSELVLEAEGLQSNRVRVYLEP
ncbi:MAG TPA: hypothetical protein VKG79_06150 [Bryobacteraceae bacterium]|nr:hypothetical protein [Bryobacteraceae bacterium]